MPTVVFLIGHQDRDYDVIIGVDPHKLSHTATAVDPLTNMAVASLGADSSLAGYRELLRWATQSPQRRWAIENAKGLGCHLAQWSSLVTHWAPGTPARGQRDQACHSS
jgi:transposase